MGLGGVEPPTSRLSGVRSNHLSYKPQACQYPLTHTANTPCCRSIARASPVYILEDRIAEPAPNYRPKMTALLRKEVIQPHLPVRLPCYDLAPVMRLTLDTCLPEGLAQRRQVLRTSIA